MLLDLEWDEAAYLLAVIGKPRRRIQRRIRANLIYAMTYYDGNTSNRESPDIKRRVAYWRKKSRRTSKSVKLRLGRTTGLPTATSSRTNERAK